MGKREPSADDKQLGAYGRRSWLSDGDDTDEVASAAPFNPFASPAAPEAPAPVPMARIEPVAPPPVSWPAAPPPPPPPPAPVAEAPPVSPAAPAPALPAPASTPPASTEEPGARADPDVIVPVDVVAGELVFTEPDEDPPEHEVADGQPAPPAPVSRKPQDEQLEPYPLEPDGPLQTGAPRPDLATSPAGPASPAGGIRARWAGRRPYAAGRPSGPSGAWWTAAAPGAAGPAPGASAGPAPTVPLGRIASQGPWRVVDTGSSVEVYGSRGGSAQPVIGTIAAGAFLLFLGPLLGLRSFGLFLAAAVVVVIGSRLTASVRGPIAFLRADEYGLHLRSSALGNGLTSIPWHDIAQMESKVQGLSLPQAESWWVRTVGGEQVRIFAMLRQQSWNPYRSLRMIMIGVAQFPLRLGRPALPIDGVPGPTPFGHLPPPPDQDPGRNENVF